MRHRPDEEWSDEAREAIAYAIAQSRNRSRPGAVVFDFDNTCVAGDCGALIHRHLSRRFGWAFDDGFLAQIPASVGHEAIARGWSTLATAIHAARRDPSPEALDRLIAENPAAQKLYGELIAIFPRYFALHGAEETYAWATSLYVGLTVDEVERHAREMLHVEGRGRMAVETIEATIGEDSSFSLHRGLRRRPAFASLIERLHGQGMDVRIVSASNAIAVRIASRWTGVAAGRVHGNLALIEGERLGSTPRAPITWGPGKVRLLQQLDLERPLLAFGDSWTDRDLLDFAERGILIDRGDADLRAYARRQGWAITAAERFSSVPFER